MLCIHIHAAAFQDLQSVSPPSTHSLQFLCRLCTSQDHQDAKCPRRIMSETASTPAITNRSSVPPFIAPDLSIVDYLLAPDELDSGHSNDLAPLLFTSSSGAQAPQLLEYLAKCSHTTIEAHLTKLQWTLLDTACKQDLYVPSSLFRIPCRGKWISICGSMIFALSWVSIHPLVTFSKTEPKLASSKSPHALQILLSTFFSMLLLIKLT